MILHCDQHFYGAACENYCKRQDAASGHYECDRANGRKICHRGKSGTSAGDSRDIFFLVAHVIRRLVDVPPQLLTVSTSSYPRRSYSGFLRFSSHGQCKISHGHGQTWFVVYIYIYIYIYIQHNMFVFTFEFHTGMEGFHTGKLSLKHPGNPYICHPFSL